MSSYQAPCETMNYNTLKALAESLGIEKISNSRSTLCAQISAREQAMHGPLSCSDLTVTALRRIAKVQGLRGYSTMSHEQLCNEFGRMMANEMAVVAAPRTPKKASKQYYEDDDEDTVMYGPHHAPVSVKGRQAAACTGIPYQSLLKVAREAGIVNPARTVVGLCNQISDHGPMHNHVKGAVCKGVPYQSLLKIAKEAGIEHPARTRVGLCNQIAALPVDLPMKHGPHHAPVKNQGNKACNEVPYQTLLMTAKEAGIKHPARTRSELCIQLSNHYHNMAD